MIRRGLFVFSWVILLGIFTPAQETRAFTTPLDFIPAVDNNLRDLSLGFDHSCALTSDNKIECWGNNEYGQLGIGTIGGYRARPIEVQGLDVPIKSISAGGQFTCALANNGNVYCWGKNTTGTLGDGTFNDSGVPKLVQISNVRSISAGYDHACAISDNNVLSCWGHNDYGQLGNGNPAPDSNIPFPPEYPAKSAEQSNIPIPLPRKTASTDHGLKAGTIQAVATGKGFTCAVIDGGVQCWGYDNFGELGRGFDSGIEAQQNWLQTHDIHFWDAYARHILMTHASPEDVLGLPSSVHSISAKTDSVCALLGDQESLFCWGNNTAGNLEPATTASFSNVPLLVYKSPTPILSMSIGTNGCVIHPNIFLDTINELKCWGDNAFGQNGVRMASPKSTISEIMFNVKDKPLQVAVHTTHTCATFESGRLKCWGSNTKGQLGDGSTLPRYSPIEVFVLGGYYWGINHGWAKYNSTSYSELVAPEPVDFFIEKFGYDEKVGFDSHLNRYHSYPRSATPQVGMQSDTIETNVDTTSNLNATRYSYWYLKGPGVVHAFCKPYESPYVDWVKNHLCGSTCPSTATYDKNNLTLWGENQAESFVMAHRFSMSDEPDPYYQGNTVFIDFEQIMSNRIDQNGHSIDDENLMTCQGWGNPTDTQPLSDLDKRNNALVLEGALRKLHDSLGYLHKEYVGIYSRPDIYLNFLPSGYTFPPDLPVVYWEANYGYLYNCPMRPDFKLMDKVNQIKSEGLLNANHNFAGAAISILQFCGDSGNVTFQFPETGFTPRLSDIHLKPLARQTDSAFVPFGTKKLTIYDQSSGRGVLTTTIFTPSGRIISSTMLDGDVYWKKKSGLEMYSISNPEAGLWRIEYSGANLPPEGITFLRGTTLEPYDKTVTILPIGLFPFASLFPSSWRR